MGRLGCGQSHALTSTTASASRAPPAPRERAPARRDAESLEACKFKRLIISQLPVDTHQGKDSCQGFQARSSVMQVSSQQAVAYLLYGPSAFAANTENFMRVLAFPDHKLTRVVRSAAELKSMDENSRNVFKKDRLRAALGCSSPTGA